MRLHVRVPLSVRSKAIWLQRNESFEYTDSKTPHAAPRPTARARHARRHCLASPGLVVSMPQSHRFPLVSALYSLRAAACSSSTIWLAQVVPTESAPRSVPLAADAAATEYRTTPFLCRSNPCCRHCLVSCVCRVVPCVHRVMAIEQRERSSERGGKGAGARRQTDGHAAQRSAPEGHHALVERRRKCSRLLVVCRWTAVCARTAIVWGFRARERPR